MQFITEHLVKTNTGYEAKPGVTGSASSATPLQRDEEQGFDPTMARAILQQWAETKEDGSVERTFTQVAQTWPLGDNVKFENIEAAINVLKVETSV